MQERERETDRERQREEREGGRKRERGGREGEDKPHSYFELEVYKSVKVNK